MGEVGRRIARIKLVPFEDALRTVAPAWLEIPDSLPAMIECPLPDHDDVTPSCWVQPHRWHCFGCGCGGDVLDLVQGLIGVEVVAALRVVEHALGFRQGEDEELFELLARSRARPSPTIDRRSWEAELEQIERDYFDRVRPYLRCRDPIVSGRAWSVSDYVFARLALAAWPVPKTARRAREVTRRLRSWSQAYAAGLEADVERITGKDRLDVSLQHWLQ